MQRSINQISFVHEPSINLVVDTLIYLYEINACAHSQGIVHILRGFSSIVPLTNEPSQNAILFTQFLQLSAPYLLLPSDCDTIIADMALLFSQIFTEQSPHLAKRLEDDLFGTPLWSTFLFQSLGASRIANPNLWAAFWSNVMQRALHLSSDVHDSTKITFSFIIILCELLKYVNATLGPIRLEEFLSAAFVTWDQILAKFLKTMAGGKSLEPSHWLQRFEELLSKCSPQKETTISTADSFPKAEDGQFERAATYPLSQTHKRQLYRRWMSKDSIETATSTVEVLPQSETGITQGVVLNDIVSDGVVLENTILGYKPPATIRASDPATIRASNPATVRASDSENNQRNTSQNAATTDYSTDADYHITTTSTVENPQPPEYCLARLPPPFTFRRRRQGVARRPSLIGPTLADWAPLKILLLADKLLSSLDEPKEDWEPIRDNLTLLVGDREETASSKGGPILSNIPVSHSNGGYYYACIWNDEVFTILDELEMRSVKARGTKPTTIDSRNGTPKILRRHGWLMRNMLFILSLVN